MTEKSVPEKKKGSLNPFDCEMSTRLDIRDDA